MSGGRVKSELPVRGVLLDRDSAITTALVKVVSHTHSLGVGGTGRCGAEGGETRTVCRFRPMTRATSNWR